MTKKLTLAGYDTLETVGTEIDVLESFINDYNGSSYICDVINEIADQQTPVYNNELWNMAPKVRDYIESAIEEGLTGEETDLMRIFSTGIYHYYTSLLHENVTELCYNYIATIVNKWVDTLNYDQKEKLDIDKLDERIEYERADIDTDSYIEDLEDIAKRIIAEFKGKINKDSSWENYGDASPLEYGGEFIKKDADYPTDKCYYIVKVTNMDNACGGDGYMIEEGYIDLKDDWIDWDAVNDFADSDSDELKVCALVSFYSIENFGGETCSFDDESEVLEHLAEKGICIEN